MSDTLVTPQLLDTFQAAAIAAGQAILDLRRRGVEVTTKDDRSPVTAADLAAEAIIIEALSAAFPAVAIVAEESGASAGAADRVPGRFFLIDPLDGTREFVAGRDEFTVNIALVENGRSVAGAVLAPAMGELFVGSRLGAFRVRVGENGCGPAEPIAVRARPARPIAIASRSHRTAETNAYLESLDLAAVHSIGSSLKFCRIADGSADLYPCFGRTMEWDTAAGQAVLEAAGGRVMVEGAKALTYGKRGSPGDYANPSFVASNDPATPIG